VQDLLADPDIPEFYVDSARLAISPFGVVIDLGVTMADETSTSELPPVRRVARVRMSPQHALILGRLLNKTMATYQEKVGKLELPADIYKALGLDPE
jgi:hypothetical protein